MQMIYMLYIDIAIHSYQGAKVREKAGKCGENRVEYREKV